VAIEKRYEMRLRRLKAAMGKQMRQAKPQMKSHSMTYRSHSNIGARWQTRGPF